jgi:hypothetical protein
VVNGWKFNRTTDYLTTTYVATDANNTGLAQFSNASALGYQRAFGSQGPTNTRFTVSPTYSAVSGGQRIYGNGGYVILSGATYASGNIGVAGNQGYYNGAPEGGAISAWSGVNATTLAIGALNHHLVGITQYFWGYMQALAIYDCTLTAPQVAAVAAAMAAL